MAHIAKVAGKWRAEVCIDKKRRAKSFATKRECVAWATEQEQAGVIVNHTLLDVIKAYKPIAEAKKGWQAELSRIKSLEASTLAYLRLDALTPAKISAWRDELMKKYAPNSVRRDMIVLGAMLSIARKEWGWMIHDPMSSVRRPTPSPARRRGICQSEISTILENLNKTPVSRQIGTLFELSIETGMRLSEMIGLRWDDVHDKHITLMDSKNGDKRDVPLSARARELIATRLGRDTIKVFTTTPAAASRCFARNTINGVHFHDARSEAITRLSKKLDVMQLARMVGHRDLKSLMFYYAEQADQIADRL